MTYMRRTAPIIILTLICALLISMAAAVALGPSGISFGSLFTSDNAWMILWEIRVPRVIAAALVGCGLAVAGTAMQALFRNPMADPYIIGTSSGGALGGATLAIVLFAGTGRPVLAFAGGAIGATFAVYFIARRGGKIPVETLLLSGVALATLLSALLSFLMYTAGRSLHQIMFWLMGGFWNIAWNDVGVALPILIGGAQASTSSHATSTSSP